ncbi:MAG: hypothetical protein J1F67_09510 [Muribaculaceae bacterium]|nr:hypothetical protein [Muribaculaceae bacterium]
MTISRRFAIKVTQIYLDSFDNEQIDEGKYTGTTSMSVEGIWQGLKVFESTDIDRNSFRNGTMKGIKRTVRTNGKCLGHRKGINGKELLGYIDARKEIYVPSYNWVLENKCQEQIKKIRIMSQSKPVILLD